jgi:hypothetical protein
MPIRGRGKATEPGVRTITEAERETSRGSDKNFVSVSKITSGRCGMPDNAGNEFLGSRS